MKKIETGFAGLFVIELQIFTDERGFFLEKYSASKFAQIGINNNFVQDNFSLSKPSVIRGLHYQNNPSQTKLVSCVSGKILDVALDVRKNSKTYGKFFSIELTAQNGLMLYIPEGFAHGFGVIGNDMAGVLYKVDGTYNKAGEGGVIYNDAKVGINWQKLAGIKNPIVSSKDLLLPKL